MSFIRIERLTKKFGQVVAVDDVTIAIEKGEFVVLLGPSGCGKTTLLRCLAGLEEPDRGEIFVDSKFVFSADKGINVPPGRRGIGMVFQSYALWPHMTVYENIAFGLKLQHLPKTEIPRRVREVLEALGMPGLESRYPFELSGGQQQRVALARLLATRPPVFLMDEPLSNLDARLRVDMRSELKRLHHDCGATTVYVTHDQTEAMTMASRIVVLKGGRVQQMATPTEVYEQPANLFVADFIGMPRINLLPARPFQDGGRPWLEIGDFSVPTFWLPPKEEVIAAVRPEDISIHFESADGRVEFKVYAVLPAGPECFIHARRGDTTLVIRESGNIPVRMDQCIWISMNPERINFYDKETGLLIRPEGR